MATALDTNCILRWLLADNRVQFEAVDRLIKKSTKTIHIADLAIAETVWVLESFYQFERKDIVLMIEKILENTKFNSNRSLFYRVLPEYVRPPRVSFTDLCLTYYAELGNARLATFDQVLAKKLPKLTTGLPHRRNF